MSAKSTSNGFLAGSLVFAVFLWGASNAGTKFALASWPPIWTGGSRFICAGLLLFGVLNWTNWLGGRKHPLSRDTNRRLWWRGGLSLAVYIVVFNTALRYTAVSHVALYLGASPVWALLWEGTPSLERRTLQRYSAALLALAGVVVLFWPAIRVSTHGSWLGEVLGLAASVLWTNFGRQCRALGGELTGAETTAHTMWRAGMLLLPLSLIEIYRSGLEWRTDIVLVHLYCVVGGGVAPFAIWNHALTRWRTSQVLLFNNLIPLTTMTWARLTLKEPIMPTFWVALCLVVAGVVLGQVKMPSGEASAPVPPE